MAVDALVNDIGAKHTAVLPRGWLSYIETGFELPPGCDKAGDTPTLYAMIES
jgi:hypothetical protein